MNWIIQNQFFILLAIAIFGFSITGWFLFRITKKVKIIFGGTEGAANDLPNDSLRRIAKIEMKLSDMEPRLQIVEAISQMSVHKVGFLRFNPFHDTGGDNSFIVTLLDRKNNGILLSSLYTRTGVRVYCKAIDKGRSRYPLSEEEKKVLEETMQKGINN